jgi:hypothetical protein
MNRSTIIQGAASAADQPAVGIELQSGRGASGGSSPSPPGKEPLETLGGVGRRDRNGRVRTSRRPLARRPLCATAQAAARTGARSDGCASPYRCAIRASLRGTNRAPAIPPQVAVRPQATRRGASSGGLLAFGRSRIPQRDLDAVPGRHAHLQRAAYEIKRRRRQLPAEPQRVLPLGRRRRSSRPKCSRSWPRRRAGCPAYRGAEVGELSLAAPAGEMALAATGAACNACDARQGPTSTIWMCGASVKPTPSPTPSPQSRRLWRPPTHIKRRAGHC